MIGFAFGYFSDSACAVSTAELLCLSQKIHKIGPKFFLRILTIPPKSAILNSVLKYRLKHCAVSHCNGSCIDPVWADPHKTVGTNILQGVYYHGFQN